MALTLTKAPPPPPKIARLGSITPKAGVVTGHREVAVCGTTKPYSLPMAGSVPAWVVVLRKVGYPINVVVIDFETYFDEDYSMRGGDGLDTIQFVMDPRFEVLSVATTSMWGELPYANYEQHTLFVCGEEKVTRHIAYLQACYGPNLERCVIVAQNAKFDMAILAFRFGIFPKFIIDVLGLARAWNSRERNDLDHLCERWSLPPKGDTMEFKGVTLRTRFTKPKTRKKGPKLPVQRPKMTTEQETALCQYNSGDNLREWELFTILLPLLSNPVTELRLMLHTLELFTKPTLRINPDRGRELAGLYEAQIDAALPVGMTREEISGNITFDGYLCEAITAAGENPQTYYKPCKKGYMLAVAKADAERELLLNHPNDRVRTLMRARVALKSWPLHIARVERIMAQAAANGGLLPVPLKYHGAHTGRWSGDDKINLQNLSKRGDPLLARIREMIEAPAGQSLVIVDLAAIEARVLAWIADQLDLVEKFKNGEEIYCGFASKVLGYLVRKPRKSGGIPAIERRMAWARNSIGKIGILGCGYGMGGDKAEGYATGAIDNATAHKLVATYRAEHPRITAFWKDIENAFGYTARYHRPCSLPRGLQFDSHHDCDVVVTLPNGRELHYHKVEFGEDDYGRPKLKVYNALEHSWEWTWGGTLTENVVQAMSRDVIAEAVLRLEDAGFHTAHHIHDEVVICVPTDQGESTLKKAVAALSVTPAWAPGLPLSAEGAVRPCYGDH